MKIYSNSGKMTFEGKRENSQSFANFEQFYKSYYAENSGNLVINSMRDENLRGEGFKNSVYRIPENDTFLLRVKKRSQNPLQITGLQKVVDNFPELNLGQRVAKLNDDVTVIVAQSGTPCGIRHWEGTKFIGVNKTDLPVFVNCLKKISKFPQSAYDNLAKEIKLIFKNNNSFDWLNSQNVLYDEEKKVFNIVDVEKRYKTKFTNCDLIIPNTFLDSENFFEFLKMSDVSQKNQILSSSAEIVKKSNIAYYRCNKTSSPLSIYAHISASALKHGIRRLTNFIKMHNLIRTISARI